MVAWAAGDAVTAHVDRCYRYYGTAETAHARCEGYWARRGAPAVRGPLLGVPVAALAAMGCLVALGWSRSRDRDRDRG